MKKKISLIVILLVAGIDFMGLGLVFPLFPYLLFKKEFALVPNLDSETIRGFYFGLLLALFSIGQFLSGPILGGFSDRIGRRKILIFSLLLGISGYLLSVLAIALRSLYLLFFSRIIVGICSGSAGVVQASLSDISTTEEKAKYFAYYNVAMGIGLTIGPFLGGVLSSPNLFHRNGVVIPFWFGALITALSLLLVITSYKETHFAPKNQKINFLSSLYDLKKAFHMKGIRILLLAMFAFIFGWAFYFEFISIYLIKQYNFTSEQVGYFYGYSALLYAICSGFLIMPIIKKVRIEKVLFFSMLLTGVYTFVFLFIDRSIYLWFYLPILLYFFSFSLPTSTTLVSNWAGEEMQGEVLGIYQSIQSVAWAAAPLFSGALLGIYDFMPILVGGGAILLSAFIYGAFGAMRTGR